MTNHVNVKYHKSPVWNCHSEDKHSFSIGILIPSTTKYINMCSILCDQTMVGSSLPPIVCKKAHVLLTFLCLLADSGVQRTFCWGFFCFCFCFFSLSCVPYIASFSGRALIYVICVCLLYTYCVFVCFSSSCVPYVGSFSGKALIYVICVCLL